jgi:Flp pilus assembly protein TadD/predicted  nucleic acid-binding Zn-ribbon protein
MSIPLASNRVVFSVILTFCCLFASPRVQANEARAAWMAGYQKLEQARQAEDDGRDEAAALLYKSAKDIFLDVKARFPGWNTTLIRYRIKFCDERLEALRTKIESGVKTMSKNEVLRLYKEQQAKLDTLQSAIKQQKRELDVTSEALERARREAARNAAAREQTESLLREKQTLKNLIDLLNQKTERLEKNLEEAREDKRGERRANMLADRLKVVEAEKAEQDKKMAAMQSRIADLASKNSALGAEAQQLKTSLLSQKELLTSKDTELANRDKNVNALTSQLGEERTRTAVATQQIDSLSKRLEESQKNNTAQAEALADLEKKLREALKDREKNIGQDQDMQKQLKALNQLIKDKDKRLGILSADLENARQKTDSLEQQLIRAQTTTKTRIAQTVRLSSQLESLHQERQADTAKLQELQKKVDFLSQDHKGVEEVLERQKKTILELKSTADRAVRQADARLSLLRRQEDEIKTLGLTIDKLTAENTALRNQTRPVEQSTDVLSLKKDLQTALTETEYHRQEAADAKKDLRNARAEAARFQKEAVDAEAELKLLTDQLKAASDNKTSAIGAQKAIENRLKKELETTKQLVSKLKQQLEARPDEVNPPVQTQATASPEPQDDARVTALLHKGVQAEKEGNPEAAVWNYKKALNYQPQQVIALRRLGALSLASGDTGKAIHYLNRAFYVDPDNVSTLTQLGFAYMRNEKADMAFSMLSRAAALDADSAAVHTQLGVACSSLGWREAAEIQFRRALKQNPTYTEAAFNLALLLGSGKSTDHMNEARKWYRTARTHGAEADPQLDTFFNYIPESPEK